MRGWKTGIVAAKWEESRLSGLVNTRWSDYIGGRAEHGPYPRRGGVSP